MNTAHEYSLGNNPMCITGMQKNSAYHRLLDPISQNLLEFGLVDHWIQIHRDENGGVDCMEGGASPTVLRFYHIQWWVVVCVGCLSLAGAVLGAELCVYRWKARTKC